MAGMTCDFPGCSNLIVKRCTQCKGSYCVRHIAQNDTRCDLCIRANHRIGGKIMKWGCLISLGGLLVPAIILFAAATIHLPIHVSDAFGQFLSTGLTVIMSIGVFVILIGLIIAFIGFIKNG